ncbi:hypothetical protein TNCV_519651 [Trichonephila clavipes]|nr:hypothetical protein TNCV_519651 [Trichonephila clavipes]
MMASSRICFPETEESSRTIEIFKRNILGVRHFFPLLQQRITNGNWEWYGNVPENYDNAVENVETATYVGTETFGEHLENHLEKEDRCKDDVTYFHSQSQFIGLQETTTCQLFL